MFVNAKLVLIIIMLVVLPPPRKSGRARKQKDIFEPGPSKEQLLYAEKRRQGAHKQWARLSGKTLSSCAGIAWSGYVSEKTSLIVKSWNFRIQLTTSLNYGLI